MQVGTVLQELERIAPPSYQESYDNAGLLTGSRTAEVTGVLLCLDSTEAVLDEAIEKGYNLIIAHHPIVFSGLKKITGRTYIERVIIKAIKHDLNLYVAHTNLDNVYHQGVNAKIAARLGLQQTRILAPKKQLLCKLCVFVPHAQVNAVQQALFDAGAGNIGAYSACSFTSTGTGGFKASESANPTVGTAGERHEEPETKLEVIFEAYKQGHVLRALRAAHPYEEPAFDLIRLENAHAEVGSGMLGTLAEPVDAKVFLQGLKTQLRTEVVRHTALHKAKVQRIAVCGGAGSFLLNAAKAAGADVFITGDYKYHQFFDADDAIIIADVGHFESEQFTIELFFEIIQQKFSNLAVQQTTVRTNPVHYI